jgi:hypothetical protein
MNGLVILCGLYISVEAIVSLNWTHNDKWFISQLVRVSRIIIGAFIICVGVYIG